jgi:hypothetical protein
MMSCPINSLPSDSVALAYALEECPSKLPTTPIWNRLTNNSYDSGTGTQTETVAREPINESRQNFKGTVVKENASIGFEHDLLQEQTKELVSGFMFCNIRKKPEASPTAVTATAYTVPSSTGFVVGRLIFASGFTNPQNNGLKIVTAVTATSVSCSGLVAEASPPAGDMIKVVGFDGNTGDITFFASGGVTSLRSTTLTLTGLGLIGGEMVYIGGDDVTRRFDTAANNGWAEVVSVTANEIVLKGMDGVQVTDTGAGKQIRMFIGDVMKNEATQDLQIKKSFCFERKLSSGMFQYINGSMPNTISIDMALNEKLKCNMAFLAMTSQVDSTAKAGTRPALVNDELLDTASRVSRLRLYNEDTNQVIMRHISSASITINNNLKEIGGIGYAGPVDFVPGTFAVEGSLQGYFTNPSALEAVKNNNTVSLSFAGVAKNKGIVINIPCFQLGEGTANVEKNAEITLPLSAMAVAHPILNHTLMYQTFNYLPALAETNLA